jgi:uncharacterized repeat protein (TIGR03803 family)
VNGLLYGTTSAGGDNPQGGTAFVVDPSTGQEQVLYSFCSGPRCSDGGKPSASLIEVNGALYGTTSIGGVNNKGSYSGGTIFSIYPGSGQETVNYSFCNQQNCADGQLPSAGLTELDGLLFGTTASGGANDEGTLFAFNPTTGQLQVLHTFGGGADGSSPRATMIDVRGTLYGTTQSGGTYNGGTVFAFDPVTGAESIIYSFCSQQNCTDGSNPIGGLIRLDGSLYGTTYTGGAYNGGTLYSLSLKGGAAKTLYSFCSQSNCADGNGPYTSLVKFKGILYGTTSYGGTDGCHNFGCGTVFSLDPATGTETQVYSFCSQQDCADGANPGASLIHARGKLYGTTFVGGVSAICQGGCGTVYAITP